MDRIDLILYILIVLVAIHIIEAVLRVYFGFRDSNKIKSEVRRYISEGKLIDALAFCESRLVKQPYDSQLLWLQAEILFKMEDYAKSREKFEHILGHEPSWRDEAQKYIDVIDSKT